MARVGKSRVLGSSALIYIEDLNGNRCAIGEVDKFSAKELGELKKSRPLGKKEFASQYDSQGFELTFEGGKVDANQAALFHSITTQFLNGGRTPYFQVVQKITLYDGDIETYTYNDVTLYDFNVDINGSGDELMEKFTGFASSKVAGDQAVDAVNVQKTRVASALQKMESQQPGTKALANAIDTALAFLTNN